MVKISIIIPVFNNLDLTIQCVKSLKKFCNNIDYEIVISDDCSTDETKEYFLSQQNITYIRNKKNMGFAFTCNRGAEIAKGEILLFLNNDTLIIDNFLIKIFNTYENISNLGIVGGKLLYEDNTIQHGGILFYPNNNVGHLFKNFPSNYAPANKIRELQCVTGACLAVRKDLFFKVGSFDERFINGFEDIDLCFKIREIGYKVIYNPEICLYHFEEKTRNFIKKKSETNNIKLLSEKWYHKIKPDFFLLNEGFDYKLNDIGDFYLIKKNFNSLNDFNLLLAIQKEPLYFYGYKKLISKLLDKKEYNLAEVVCKNLILFEPIIENFYILKNIALLEKKNNIAISIENTIRHLNQEKERIKPYIKAIYKRYLSQNKIQIAKYYEDWLKNYDI